ncbi:MAG: exonuclease domain-containing protein [Rhodospirillales bacterium]
MLIAIGIALWLINNRIPESTSRFTSVIVIYGAGLALALTSAIGMLWAYLDRAIAQPLGGVVRGIQTVLHANLDHRVDAGEGQHLGSLPAVVNDLIRQLATARLSVDETVTRATAKIEERKNQLESVLHDLDEGVIVCTLEHKILLYNARALALLHIAGTVGLDRSLFQFMTQQPIEYALALLISMLSDGGRRTDADEWTMPFTVVTTDGRHTLQGRMRLILDAGRSPSSYVISFEDRTDELAAIGLRDRLLREATEGLRAPVANMRAAAEILASGTEVSIDDRVAFHQVLLTESYHICSRIEHLSGQYRDIVTNHWPMSDVYSPHLFESLSQRLHEQRGIQSRIVGLPCWFHGDSYTLVELLDRLVFEVSRATREDTFEFEASPGDHYVYIDAAWSGSPVAAVDLSKWLLTNTEESFGGLSLSEILQRHRTDVWCHDVDGERSRLRLPLSPPSRSHDRSRPALPPRPEFYDFDLLRRPHGPDVRHDTPLSALSYVAFDTETTGLKPDNGDEIISIAGVRIVNNRILTGENFQRLINPRRSIPEQSRFFHGISEEMIKDKPPIAVVLPQFHAFIGDAVLIAHNASFDMRFIHLKEAEAGAHFTMPVLDTLLLSAFLHDHTERHNLDAVANRFAVTILGRHSALGDALAVAGIFVKMLNLLAARGISTLGDALAVSQKVMQKRTRQERML